MVPARVRSYAELVEVIRARILELQTTLESVDAVSGVQPGYTAKLIVGMKRLGPVSWDCLFDTLGLEIVVRETGEQEKIIASRLAKRMVAYTALVPHRQIGRPKSKAKVDTESEEKCNAAQAEQVTAHM